MSPRRTDSAEPAAIRRYDEMSPWALRAPRRRESDGVLLADGIVAREGVLTYQLADGGTRRELVTADALTSMARTLGRAAVTREHPPEFVSPDNVQQYGVGDTDGQPKVILDEAEGGYVQVSIAVRRKDAIADVEGGTRVELSPGYIVEIDETPGTHPRWGAYDARQIARTANHLALVESARGGPTVRLRVDSQDAVAVRTDGRAGGAEPTPPERIAMKPTLIQLAALFGVARTDSEDGLLAELLPAAKAAKKRADEADAVRVTLAAPMARVTAAANKVTALSAKRTDAADFAACKTACDECAAACDACIAECEKMGESGDACKAACVACKAACVACAAECESAMEATTEVDAMKAEEVIKTDAASLVSMKALADKVGVKPDGLKLDALRLAVARTAVKDLPDNASAARIDGVLDVVRAAPADTRYDGWMGDRKPPAKVAPDPHAPKITLDPWARHDDAHNKIHGGAL